MALRGATVGSGPALLDAGGRQRQAEEIGLTLVFLRTLREWLRDATPGHQHTRRYLARRLVWVDCLTREGRSIMPPAASGRRARFKYPANANRIYIGESGVFKIQL